MVEPTNLTSICYNLLTQIEKDQLNINNNYEYSPFLLDPTTKTITIDKEWSQRTSKFLPDLISIISKEGYTIMIDEVKTPHEKQDTSSAKALFWKIYLYYADQFDYDRWFKWIADRKPDFEKKIAGKRTVECYEYKELNGKTLPVFFISLKRYEVNYLIEKSKSRLITGSKFKTSDLEDVEDLDNLLNLIIKEYFPNGVFVKNRRKSCKNNLDLKPLTSGLEICDMLTACEDIFKTWEKEGENLLILMEFNTSLDPDREFRVFVIDGKVKAISQQKWYKVLEWIPIPEMVRNIVELWESQLKKRLLYYDVVLDLYFDIEGVPHLIECNPGSLWSSSGSSLFNWIVDKDLMESDEIVVRMYVKEDVVETFKSKYRDLVL